MSRPQPKSSGTPGAGHASQRGSTTGAERAGPTEATRPQPGSSVEQEWPGQRLGLPRSGPGAVAGWGRRIVALVVDWALSMLVVGAFIGRDVWSGQGFGQWGPLAVFALEAWVFTSLLGGSAGQLVMRVVVRRTTGGPLDPLRALARTLLICLVVPPLVYNRDQRGVHDFVADSITLCR